MLQPLRKNVTTVSNPSPHLEFAHRMASWGSWKKPFKLAVAVSGGSDSMALTLITHVWCQEHGGTLVAVTVDHGLRPDSASEAQQVKQWLEKYNIPHHILRWHGDKPSSNIQANARNARYDLLTRWAKDQGIERILLGHHQEDQAETLLLRLSRGSGVDGLSAMAGVTQRGGVYWLRPLLNISKTTLLEILEQHGQEWITDPSNRNLDYQRVRWRQILPSLETVGLTQQRLAQTAHRFQRARQALEQMTDDIWQSHILPYPMGYLKFSTPSHWNCPEEIALRLISRMLKWVSGNPYPPRLEKLEYLSNQLLTCPRGDRTLLGCRVVWNQSGGTVTREAARIAPPQCLYAGKSDVWDQRFSYHTPADFPSGLKIGTLGNYGRRKLEKLKLPIPLPSVLVRLTLPAIWDQNDQLCAIPHLGYTPALDIAPLHIGSLHPTLMSRHVYVPKKGQAL